MFRFGRAFGIAAAGALALAAPAFAQSVSTPSASPVPEIGRVSTAERHDVPSDATPKRTYVVDRAAIESYGMRTVADVLRFVPGVLTFGYGAFGAQTNYGILGTSSSQTLVLVNGIPIADPTSGSADLATLSTVDVRRVEIVESAGSTLYGSSAVGGIINIVTGAPSAVSIGEGSFANRDVRASVTRARLQASVEEHTAQNAFAYPKQDGFPAGVRRNADARTNAATVAYRIGEPAALQAETRLSIDSAALGVPGSLKFPSPNARQDASRLTASVTLQRTGVAADTSLTASVVTRRLLYDDPSSGPESDTNTSRSRLALKRLSTAGSGTVLLGLDASADSALIAPSPATQIGARASSVALYGQFETTLGGHLSLEGGLRGENDGGQGSALLPSLGFVVRSGALRLRAAHATAFRVPTLNELFYPGFANPALLPERSVATDASIATGAAANVSAGYFARDSVNLIQTLSLNGRFFPANVARAAVRGLRFDARTAPEAHSGVTSSVSVVDTYRAQNLSPGTQPSRLAYVPVLDVVLSMERPLRNTGVGVGFSARVQGPHRESAGLRGGQTLVDGFVRAHVAGGVLTLRSRDIGDERSMPILGYPAPGRTFEIEFGTR